MRLAESLMSPLHRLCGVEQYSDWELLIGNVKSSSNGLFQYTLSPVACREGAQSRGTSGQSVSGPNHESGTSRLRSRRDIAYFPTFDPYSTF
jgi:hypothetical protein